MTPKQRKRIKNLERELERKLSILPLPSTATNPKLARQRWLDRREVLDQLKTLRRGKQIGDCT